MKICVTSQGNNLDFEIDPRFGRCQYFMLVDSETLEFEAVQNENVQGMGGIGIKSGQLMSDKEVSIVITGNVGPNAFKTLDAAGIGIITGAKGNIKAVIEKFNRGELKKTSASTVESHAGI